MIEQRRADKDKEAQQEIEKEIEKEQSEALEVDVYRSTLKADTYLFVRAAIDPDDLPEILREQFLETPPFLNFALTPDRYLAQADPVKVLSSLNAKGFYLQMPPQPEGLDAD